VGRLREATQRRPRISRHPIRSASFHPKRTIGKKNSESVSAMIFCRVDACTQGIVRNPELHKTIHEQYRRGAD
jgi:hypothetical protein